MTEITTPLLDRINSPQDLRKLPVEELSNVCDEIRAYLIDSVSKTAGHLASGLAVVELTTAIHYVFDTPKDKLVWDVGHQSYPHKILTGHKDRLRTLRQKDGLHAFIYRGETEYDLISTGHASTSIGSALGLAVAEREFGTHNKVVAVIGDGALSGGAAYEAMNCAGSTKDIDLIVILNDNEMSISQNVGSVSQYLASILANPYYVKFVEGGKKVLQNLPTIKQLAEKAQEHVKGMIMPGTFFEELGFNYIGPVDGHDIEGLVSILQNVKKIGGLQLVHVVTKKGKGYTPAEDNPTLYHGVPVFDPQKGIMVPEQTEKMSFSDNFGLWLSQRAKIDKKLMAITPAMPVGSGMKSFAEKYPKQFFDVGIAEQHAMVFASGLAAGGLHPVVAIYSTFLQRAYDGLIHDMAIQDLPILLAVDRGGIVGPDGPTHQGMFDIAFMRCIPNLVIMTPSNLKEQYLMLNTGYALNRPCVVRYERNTDDCLEVVDTDETIAVGKGRIVNHGSKVALCCFGTLVNQMMDLAEKYDLTLADMRFVKPLDEELIEQLAKDHKAIITMEQGVIEGGVGQEIAVRAASVNRSCTVINLGFHDHFIMEGTIGQLLEDEGLDLKSVEKVVLELL
ncbi:MAG: 1-deoxy-D-xylulose-5-phosphate synthase [Succinivibrio sp.]